MRSKALLAAVLVAVSTWVACGSGSANTSTTNSNPSAKSSTVQVSLGDDPSDRVASLSVTINGMQLVSDSGTTVNLLSAPATVEITSLAGTTTPLNTVSVPAGNYTKAVITLGGATMTFVDPNTGATVQKTFPAPTSSITINLTTPFTASGSALVINFNLDLHKSVAVDSSGNLTFNPLFLVTHGALSGPSAGHPPDPFTGGMDHVLGVVTGVNGTSFTVKTAMGQRTLTFATNSSTEFEHVSGVASLQTGMLVTVEGQAQSDGSLLATDVEVVNGMQNATGAIGLVTATTGTPVTQFTMVARGLAAAASMPTGMGPVPNATLTVNVGSGTAFRIDTKNVDMTGLSMTFDASSLSPAQVVEADAAAPVSFTSGTGMSGMMPTLGTITATQVQLEPQPVAGTVSNLTSNSFTLTVAPDSLFATLTKATTITVYKQSGTEMEDSFTLANGQKVVVRGLLFNNSGYQMVATRMELMQ